MMLEYNAPLPKMKHGLEVFYKDVKNYHQLDPQTIHISYDDTRSFKLKVLITKIWLGRRST